MRTRRCDRCHESKPLNAYPLRPDLPHISNRGRTCRVCRHEVRVQAKPWGLAVHFAGVDLERRERLDAATARIRSHPEWRAPSVFDALEAREASALGLAW